MAGAGHSLRTVTKADLDRAYDLVRSAADGLGIAANSSREALARLLAHDSGHLLAMAGEAEQALLLVVPVRGRTVFIEVHARPGCDAGLYDILIQEGIAAARRICTGDPAPALGGDPYRADPRRWQVAAAPTGGDDQYRAALLRAGFRHDQRYWRMRLALTAVGDGYPPAPAGVTRSLADTEETLRTAHDILTRSFQDNHGVVTRTFEQWLAALPVVSGSEIWLAHINAKAVAICWCDDSRLDTGDAFVRDIGVLPEARRRGIGRWLLRCAITEAKQRGRRGVALDVDSENPTGAPALYESLGFERVGTVDDWRLPL